MSLTLWVYSRRGGAPRWVNLYHTGGGVFRFFPKALYSWKTVRLVPVGYLAAGLDSVYFMIPFGACI